MISFLKQNFFRDGDGGNKTNTYIYTRALNSPFTEVFYLVKKNFISTRSINTEIYQISVYLSSCLINQKASKSFEIQDAHTQSRNTHVRFYMEGHLDTSAAAEKIRRHKAC